MAWNTPGNSSGDGRTPRPPRRGTRGIDAVLDPLRNLLDNGPGNIGRWVAVALVLWILFNCFVLVQEQERGVVLRFGRVARVLQPGPHLKAPWPIESVTKLVATQSEAYSETVPVLTRDGNMVNVEINVQYRIGEPIKYLFGTRQPADILKQAVQSVVREQVGRSDLDTVLGARGALSTVVRARLQTSLDAYRTGLLVTELNLPNARPPDDVKDAFDDAQRATSEKTTSINEAQAYAKRVVPEARGDSARIRTAAEGYRNSVVARAQGDAARFDLLVEQYQAAPEVTRKRLWLETVQQVLADNRTIVGGDSRQLIYVPMESKGTGATGASAPLVDPERLAPTVLAEPEPERGRQSRQSRGSREESSR